jgi:hypothetical protein
MDYILRISIIIIIIIAVVVVDHIFSDSGVAPSIF